MSTSIKEWSPEVEAVFFFSHFEIFRAEVKSKFEYTSFLLIVAEVSLDIVLSTLK